METAIRWSQNSTEDNARFLHVDVAGKALRLCQITSWNNGKIDYQTISSHTKVPSFRAFDWSPSNEALVAVGQSSGEATVLRIDDGSQGQLSFQIRNQRLCNSVAFSTQNLLAAGLDKVRNDFCLNIWDLQQRLPSPGTRGFREDKLNSDPLHKLASSEPITSIKFFQDNPQLLVAGVKGQFVRLYDLREHSAGGSLEFATRCVHNLAIDPCDENYVASCYPVNDPAICIWDRRYNSRFNSAPVGYSSAAYSEMGPPEASLELRNAVDSPGSIWSLRFSKTKRGCLGVLSSTGHFKAIMVSQEYLSECDEDDHREKIKPGLVATYPQKVFIERTQDLARAHYHSTQGSDEKIRVVSFDFTTIGKFSKSPNILTLGKDGTISVVTMESTPAPMQFSSLGYLWSNATECRSSVSGRPVEEGGQPSVGDALDRIRRKAEPRNFIRKAAKQSKQTKADGALRHPSSRKNHEWNSDLGYFEQGVRLSELLTLISTQRLRSEAGYLFSASKNKSIVSDSPWLQAFWKWIERANKYAKSGHMIQDGLDISYVGVHGIWMDDLGPPPQRTRVIGPSVPKISKVTESLARRLDIPATQGCPTAYSDHRRLCLYVSGLAWPPNELEAHVKRLVSQNRHTKAAAIAMFANERKLAYRALRHKSSTQSHKMLAMAIAGATERKLLSSAEEKEQEDDWSESIATLADDLTDPYARAILAFVRTGTYEVVVEEASLPLKDRVGVALRWLSDRKLTDFISKATKDVVTAGDVEGVILTGIGSNIAVELMGNYIRRFGDLQTAVLALSHTVPRYVDDGPAVRRFFAWRETYRHHLNSWGLKFDRVRFDIGCQKLAIDHAGKRLIEPAKPQVALVCEYCNKSIAQFENQGETEGRDNINTHATPKHPLADDKAAAIGTVCPKCGRHLPRCGVCDLWLGTPDPSHMRWYRQNRSGSMDLSASMTGSLNATLGLGTAGKKTPSLKASNTVSNDDSADGASRDAQNASIANRDVEDMLNKLTVFCIKCSHGFHVVHAREWFNGYAGRAGHSVCPLFCLQIFPGLGTYVLLSVLTDDHLGRAHETSLNMSDADAFHAKIASLKPTDQDAKPNTFWVGILKHNKKPSDNLVQTDCLWAKCGKNKDVSRIRKAYISVEAPDEDIVLRHAFKTVGFKPIEDDMLVSSMNTRGDNLVALDAVRKSDLASRMVEQEQMSLQNITDTTSVHKSAAVEVKPEPAPSPISMNSSIMPKSVPDPLTSAIGQVSSHFELAWIDFNCEHRELLQRVESPSTVRQVNAMNDRIRTEWCVYTDGQIRFFENRAQRIAAQLTGPGSTFTQRFATTCRGFWSFYYTEFYRVKDTGSDPHKDFPTTQGFFNRTLLKWQGMTKGMKDGYVQAMLPFLERNPIPQIPPSVTVGMKTESRPQNESGFETWDRSTGPSTKAEAEDSSASYPSASLANEDDQAAPARLNIPDLFADCTPEQLEKGVEKGVAILDRLKLSLAPKEGADAAETGQWVESIDNVRKQAVRTRTVIGVVGNTGAGKSSIINALLDEERLLPTNCMRACTAVITEISYNYDNDAYSAVIEFITARDWRVELETLFKDLLDGNGNVSRDCANEDSEAGIAYAKIKAVYPKLTKDDISNSSVDALMGHDNVSKLLGTSRSVKETDSLFFYKKLQSYVDSKEKTTKSDKDKSDKEKKKPKEMEFWPLIKVVRLYVRAPALSTGAVIVDLPGVHDSNQARAAVAQNYMKQCTGLWICAPINRAVDDKAAKSLLGETFKRQLKMDGGYSSVTFICSKTDDISLIEAQDSLGIEEELSELWNKCDELSKKSRILQKELEELKETKSDYSQAMEAADEELDVWEKLKDELEDGKTVYPPSPTKKGKGKKRKRGMPKKSSTKKARLEDFDADFIDDSSQLDRDIASDDDSEVESENEEEKIDPLSESVILEKIGELRATKKDGRKQRAQLDNEIKSVRSQMQEVEKEHAAVEAVISQKCIQGRNEYSKGAIQQDFAAGIKELDMEIREEEDAANFNPETDVRDYDEVARSLPVFTVSSRAYQKLKGRLAKDKDVPGFATVEETQIPQLQEHARKTTEAGRQVNCKRFLNTMSQLLNSLRLWASSDGSSSNLTELQKSQEAKVLKNKLNKLDRDLENSIQSICASLSSELQDNVFDQFSAAVQQATAEACDTANGWGRPVNRDDRASGGLYWATYKALCRRDGLFSNKQGLHDWNAELTAPIIKNIASGWERTFSRRMPSVLSGLANKSGTLLTTFHNDVEARARRNGTSLATLQVLKQQLPTYKDTMKDLSTAAQTQIATRQKDINREFVPVVAEAMKEVYNDCENESGPGQYARMKAMMSQHVDRVRQQMFNDSTNAVKKSLSKLVEDIEDFMLEKADEVFVSVKRDYEAVVLGRHVATQQLPREQRQLRSEVESIINGTQSIFKRVVGLEPEAHEASIENAGEKKASYKAEEVGRDMVMEGVEVAEETSSEPATEPDVTAEMDGDDKTAVEQIANQTVPEERTTTTTPTCHEGSTITENDHPFADPPLRNETVDPGVLEASNRLNFPAPADKRTAPLDKSDKENELVNARSMSTEDVDRAILCEAGESSSQPGRSSSVASWVQRLYSFA